MRINVSQQLKESVGSIRNYRVDETIDIVGSGSLVQGEVRLTRTDRGILVQGRLHTEVEVACSRCLSRFSCPLVLNIEDVYFPTTDVISCAPLLLPDEPGCFTIDEHHVLDLTEAIRQNALLVIPMKPLCREDCAGLCPSCGHNLNQGPCNCLPQRVDPDWSELNRLTLASDELVNRGRGTG